MSHVSPPPCSQDRSPHNPSVATGTGLKRRDRCHPNVHRGRHTATPPRRRPRRAASGLTPADAGIPTGRKSGRTAK